MQTFKKWLQRTMVTCSEEKVCESDPGYFCGHKNWLAKCNTSPPKQSIGHQYKKVGKNLAPIWVNFAFRFPSIIQNPLISTNHGFNTIMYEFWAKIHVLVASTCLYVLLSYT